jgi:hypothetical protein
MTKSPEHHWLLNREWVLVGEIRLGNRVHGHWTHGRNGERTYVTDEAIYDQLRHEAGAEERE